MYNIHTIHRAVLAVLEIESWRESLQEGRSEKGLH